MRNLKLKHTEGNQGILTLQNPNADPGLSKDGRVYTLKISEIPEGTTDAEVVRMANGTTFLAAKYDGSGRYSYQFSELGLGTIIRK
jgi:hypothetical protein